MRGAYLFYALLSFGSLLIVSSANFHQAAFAAEAADLELTRGYKHYHNGDYKSSVSILTGAVKDKHKDNAQAHYYLGNAWMKLGNSAYARHYYKRALNLKPGEPLAGYLRRALGHKDESATKAERSGSTKSGTAKSSSSSKEASREKKVSLSAEDKSMIDIFQKKNTGNTEFVYDEVASALSCLSTKTKKTLRTKGCRILIAPTILAARPDLRGVKPRGYLHGGGYDNCPGMFSPSTKTLYIPEKAAWRNSPPQLNKWAMKVSLHELGHAYDFCMSNQSESIGFREAVKKDHQKLTNTLRNKYWYYTQSGSGESELFAELFSVIHGPGVALNDENMLKVFPRATEYIKGLLR